MALCAPRLCACPGPGHMKAAMLLPTLLASYLTSCSAVSEFLCKNASSDWPLPCRRVSDAIKEYTLGRPDQPAGATFPITAWWGPV
eukprot:COSAG06_NODE_1362_length_9703_cov_30.651708_7_plen_86_part_00